MIKNSTDHDRSILTKTYTRHPPSFTLYYTYMKANYSAWEVQPVAISDLKQSEQFLQLIRYAILAPSSHNSQPWRFTIQPNTILLEPDFTRALPESDHNHRQLYISIGSALANLIVAADYYGFDTKQKFKEEDRKTSIQIILTKRERHTTEPTHLLDSITSRRTNRSKYTSSSVEQGFLNLLKELANDDSLQLFLIDDKDTKDKLTDLVMVATDEAMASQAFRSELSEYLLNNATKQSVGMPCFGMDIPTPVSFIAPKIIKNFNISKMTGKQERDILQNHTPVFGVIATDTDEPKSWITAGKEWQMISLLAEQKGYATNALAALIQIGDHYKDGMKLLQTNFRPQVFFRLGLSKPESMPPHSPRLTAEQVLTTL